MGFCDGCVPPVSEDRGPRGAPFVAYQAKQIEMSGGVRVVVACQNTLRVLHQVLPLVRGLLTRFTDMH